MPTYPPILRPLVLPLIALPLWALAGGHAQSPGASQPDTRPAQTASSRPGSLERSVRSLRQADLDAIRDRVIPLIEKHTGRKFKSIPKLEFAHNSRIGRILSSEIEVQIRNQFPSLAKKELEHMASQTASQLSLNLLGKFDLESRVLYILPGMFEILVKKKKIPKDRERQLLELVVAHELTHALQDQYLSLSSLYSRVRDQASLHAISGAIEGHATWIQDEIAKDLHLEKAAKDYHDLLPGAVGKGAKLFGQRYQRDLYISYYSRGAAFFARLVKSRATQASWTFLEHLPDNSNFLYRSALPESLEITPSKVDKKPQLLAGLARLFTKRPHSIAASTADQSLLRSFLQQAPRKQVDEILAPLERAWFVQAGNPSRMGFTMAMEFRDADAARHFFEATPKFIHRELGRALLYESKLTLMPPLPLKPPEAFGSHTDRTQVTYTYLKGRFGQTKGDIRWYRHGRHVVQIDITNLRMTSDQMDAMARRALSLIRTASSAR